MKYLLPILLLVLGLGTIISSFFAIRFYYEKEKLLDTIIESMSYDVPLDDKWHRVAWDSKTNDLIIQSWIKKEKGFDFEKFLDGTKQR